MIDSLFPLLFNFEDFGNHHKLNSDGYGYKFNGVEYVHTFESNMVVIMMKFWN